MLERILLAGLNIFGSGEEIINIIDNMGKKVSIIYLLTGGEPKKYLERAVKGVAAQTYDKKNLVFVIVYNPLENEDQNDFIEKMVEDFSSDLPEVKILKQKENIGFSAGNNKGMNYAIENGADYVFLHNGDGYLHPRAIENLVNKMQSDKKIGQAQSMVLLSSEINKINTSGNDWHYLSIGYCRDYNVPLVDFKRDNDEIGYASGAATMLRTDLLKKYGTWKEDFFLYHEDTDYSLHIKSLGYKVILASDSYFYHDYVFSKNKKKFFWIERNRHAIKILYYKWPTLILLFPIDLFYNIGLFFYALFAGWLGELFSVYIYWLQPKNWKEWLIYRKSIQKSRVVSDRFLLSKSVLKISANQVDNRYILKMVNIVFTIYGILLKMLIWW